VPALRLGRALTGAALGAALTLSAVLFGTETLLVPGLGLLVVAIVAAVWISLASRGAGLTRVGGPATVAEEEPYPLVLHLRCGVLPPGGELVEPLLARTLPAGWRRERDVRVVVRFARRGRRRLEPARAVLADPLHLAEAELRSEPADVLVLPRVEPVLVVAGGVLGGGSAAAARSAEGAEVELDALRPYRPGAPASRIHWPTVARTGAMVERRLVADADLRPLVVLDARRPRSEAASLCRELARRGGCAVLLPGDRRPIDLERDLRGWAGLHRRLAMVEVTHGAPPSVRVERAGAIFWVTAQADAGAGLGPRGLGRESGRQRVLVLPLPPGGATDRDPILFAVAGCVGVRAGRAPARAAA
jgi:hypothetical protein